MSYKTLDDIDVAGKRVLIRVDLNVPMNNGEITDDTRIRRVLPTIEKVIEMGGYPFLLSHMGRPDGKYVEELSLRPVRDLIGQLSNRPITFSNIGSGDIKTKHLQASIEPKSGGIVLFENLRFHAGEERNDPNFAQFLASLGDVYVNDAFSASHRAHASIEGLAKLRPSVAGPSMVAELKALEGALTSPERPVFAVIGGAKVSSKLDLIGNLLEKVDVIVIGGGMANTFLAAQGHPVGKSLCEHDMLDTAREIMERAEAAGCTLLLPVDVVVAEGFAANSPHRTVPADACPDDMMILDAGEETIDALAEAFEEAKTVVWNGPLGAFEIEPFDRATGATARMVADLTESGAVLSVAGGGDTVAALNAAGVAGRFSYVSTAGGAFLEWMEGKTLPGVAALS